MVTSPQSPASPDQRLKGPLVDCLTALAGTPDDASELDRLLDRVTRLSADLVAAASYASVTALREGAYTTVAATSELALAVDRAQYAEQGGPCLSGLQTGEPVGVHDVAATMAWPGFRDAAFRLGLRASLSIPLFAGSGVPVAVLNLYGHDPDEMAPLTAQVWAVYKPHRRHSAEAAPRDLDDGGRQLVDGLSAAFEVRAVIQQAIGVVMAGGNRTPDDAYLVLRVRAAERRCSLTEAAGEVVAHGGRDRDGAAG